MFRIEEANPRTLRGILRLNVNDNKKYKVLLDGVGNKLGCFDYADVGNKKINVGKIYIRNDLMKRSLQKYIANHLRSNYDEIGIGGVKVKGMENRVILNKERLHIREEKLDGINYLVAPVVMVKEQVLNGELLPAEEIAKSAVGWNGRPVVVYHPKDDNGNDTIANDPDVIPKYEVGKVFNVVYEEESTKLKGEVWIDISRAKRKNKDTRDRKSTRLNSSH